MSTNKLRQTFADELKTYYDDKAYTSAHHVIIYWSVPLDEAGNSQARKVVEIQLPSELFLQAECTRLLERCVKSYEGEGKEKGEKEKEEKEKEEKENQKEEEEEGRRGELKILFDPPKKLLEQLAAGILEATGLPMIEGQAGMAVSTGSVVPEWGNLFRGGIPLVGVRIVKGKLTGMMANDFHPPTLGAEEPILRSALWHTHQLRYFLATDYTIQLKCHETGKIVYTFATSRFLLGLRIPYFRNMFSSGMADSDTFTSTFYTDTISLEALMVICRYVYLLDSDYDWILPLFWFYTLKSTENKKAAVQLRKSIEEYISPFRHPPRKCERYMVAKDRNTGDILLPPGIIIHVVNVIKAADYLSLDDLKLYMLSRLKDLAHGFLCYCQGCAKLLPRILDTIYSDMNIPKSVLESLVQHLGRTESITWLWKRPLIMVRPEVLRYLMGEIKNQFLGSQYRDMQGQLNPEGVDKCYLLYSALIALRMQVEAKSRNTATEWEEKLISPLHEFCIQCLVGNLTWFPESSPSEDDIRLLYDIISSRYMVNGDCEGVWRLGSKIVGEVHDHILGWFKRNWLNLSLTPPQPNLNANVCPSIPNAHGKLAVPEPNFFSTWAENSLKELALELGVEVDDLLARSHTIRPLETPKRSGGRKVYQKRDLVRSDAGI